MERKEELELRKVKQQHKKYIQSFSTSKNNTSFIERKKKLELPENGKKINLHYLDAGYYFNCKLYF